jgi:hypothetical protein
VIADCPSKPPMQKPWVNNVEQLVADSEEPGSINQDSKPRNSENFMPQ